MERFTSLLQPIFHKATAVLHITVGLLAGSKEGNQQVRMSFPDTQTQLKSPVLGVTVVCLVYIDLIPFEPSLFSH